MYNSVCLYTQINSFNKQSHTHYGHVQILLPKTMYANIKSAVSQKLITKKKHLPLENVLILMLKSRNKFHTASTTSKIKNMATEYITRIN